MSLHISIGLRLHVTCSHDLLNLQEWMNEWTRNRTRRPASADRTARRQFQATGQPVSSRQANDAQNCGFWPPAADTMNTFRWNLAGKCRPWVCSNTPNLTLMTSRLPHYEAKCVQRRCFQCGSVPLRSDIKGTELPSANILLPLERQLIALQLCRWDLLYNETFQQTFRPLLSKLSKRRQI